MVLSSQEHEEAKARVERAKQRLEELQNKWDTEGTKGEKKNVRRDFGESRGQSSRANTGASTGKDKSGSTGTARTVKSDRTRQGNDEGSVNDSAYSPGLNRSALGNGATVNGIVQPLRRTTPRFSGNTEQSDRQTSRASLSVAPEEETFWQWFQHTARTVLAYAGFDVRSDARALTDKEITELTPKVAKFFQRVGTAIDYGITHTNADKDESYIWQFEDKEAEQLSVIYLKRAKKIGWMAEVARQVQHVEDVGDAKDIALIVGKRVVATGMFYNNSGGFKPWLKS